MTCKSLFPVPAKILKGAEKRNIQLDSISFYIYIYTIGKNTYILKIIIFGFRDQLNT